MRARRALAVSVALLLLPLASEGAGLAAVTRSGRAYVEAPALAASLKARLEGTPERIYMRTATHLVTFTRGWARVEIDGKPVVLEAPVEVEGDRWLVPETFMRQVLPILEGRAPMPVARAAAPAAPAPVAAAVSRRPAGRAPPPTSVGPVPAQPPPAAPVPAPPPTSVGSVAARSTPAAASSGPAAPVSATAAPTPGANAPSPAAPGPGAAPALAPLAPVPGGPVFPTTPPAAPAVPSLSASPAPAQVLPPVAEAPVARPSNAPSPTLVAVAPPPGHGVASLPPPPPGLWRGPAPASAIALADVRVRSYPSFTRVVIETSAPVSHRIESTAPKEMRIRFLSLAGRPHVEELGDGLVDEVRLEPSGPDAVMRVMFSASSVEPKASALSDPPRLLLDFPRPSEPSARATAATPLRTIVLDAGHGGHDPGAQGPTGLLEKDLVLDVTRRVAALVQAGFPGLRVLLSRKGDYFVPLRERTSFANRERADLFVSIHANAHREAASEGVETFFLSSEATDNAARQVAAAENSVIQLEKQPVVRGKRADVVKAILWDLAQSEFQQESSRLAEVVQDSMTESLRIPNRGVKQAGFYVLGGAAMPAVLIEIGFVTNPKEERRLKDGAYRDDIARAIVAGITGYKRDLDRRAAR